MFVARVRAQCMRMDFRGSGCPFGWWSWWTNDGRGVDEWWLSGGRRNVRSGEGEGKSEAGKSGELSVGGFFSRSVWSWFFAVKFASWWVVGMTDLSLFWFAGGPVSWIKIKKSTLPKKKLLKKRRSRKIYSKLIKTETFIRGRSRREEGGDLDFPLELQK